MFEEFANIILPAVESYGIAYYRNDFVFQVSNDQSSLKAEVGPK